MKKSGSDLALANCDLLLRKYTEREYAKMDTLFILAELFDRKYNNNQGYFTVINSAIIYTTYFSRHQGHICSSIRARSY